MNVRDIKLAIACGHENEEVKSLNILFDDLFKDVKIYTKDAKPDLIFMKCDKCIMYQDLKNGDLDCRYEGFWQVLRQTYHCTYSEIKDIIQYKVEEYFNMRALTPHNLVSIECETVEHNFKNKLAHWKLIVDLNTL